MGGANGEELQKPKQSTVVVVDVSILAYNLLITCIIQHHISDNIILTSTKHCVSHGLNYYCY